VNYEPKPTKPKYIYTLYVYYKLASLVEIHKMPVKFKKHASLMLMKRFGMYTKDVSRCFKVGTLIKKPEKEGDIAKRTEKICNPFRIHS